MENIKLPKENIPKAAEVREVETEKEVKLETPAVKKEEATFEKSENDMDEKDEKIEETMENVVGGASTATGGAISVALKPISKLEKNIGELTDCEGLQEAGKIHDKGADKPAEWLGEIVEGIKDIFD